MDYTLREWVRLARQHGSIAQAAVASQAAEGGVDEAAVRATMRHHLQCMQEAVRNGLDEKLKSVSGLTGGQAALAASWARRRCMPSPRRNAMPVWVRSSPRLQQAPAAFFLAR